MSVGVDFYVWVALLCCEWFAAKLTLLVAM